MKKIIHRTVLKFTLLFLFSFFIQYSFAQIQMDSTQKVNQENEQVFSIVENMPTYKGGEKMLAEFLNANLKGNCMDKKSFFQLEVMKDSTISSVRYLKKSAECDDEIVNLLKQTNGKWIAGTQNGHVCNVYQVITVKYLKGNKVNVGIGINHQLN
ncbi:MAG: hypothetical protein ABI723_07895 [Bacteroidia bacterium]